MTDWKSVYQESRSHVSLLAAFSAATAALFLVGGLGMGTYLYFSVDRFGGSLMWAGSLLSSAIQGFRAYRDYRGSPLVLTGTILKKRHSSTSSRAGSSSMRYHLRMAIREAARITADGELRTEPRIGERTVRTESRLYGDVNENDDVRLVCTPSGVAFARLEDLQPGANG